MNFGPTKCNLGFTLVEVLVATTITVVLAGLLLAVTRSVSNWWMRGTGRLVARAEARRVLDQLALDLQGTVCPQQGGVWFAATVLDHPNNSGLAETAPRMKPAGVDSGSLRITSTPFSEARFGQAGVWLRFFTYSRGSNDATAGETVSAPVGVAYQLIRCRSSDSGSDETRGYHLFRSQVRPAQAGARPGTLESGYDLSSTASSNNYSESGGFNDSSVVGDPVAIRQPRPFETVLAENVVDFGIRLYTHDPDGRRQIVFPTANSDTEYELSAASAGSGAPSLLPKSADILVRILTPEGARLVNRFEREPHTFGARPAQYATDAEWWWGLVEAHSHVFTREIAFPAVWR